MRKITKRAGVIIGVAALGISGGVAWAAWSILGTATATATATTAQPVTITAQATGLYPGGTKTLSLTANNPNPFPVEITGVGSPTITTSNQACSISNITFTPSVNSVVLQPGNTAQASVGTASMPLSALDPCQGVTFTITSSVSGISK
jgi:hypothetical protein